MKKLKSRTVSRNPGVYFGSTLLHHNPFESDLGYPSKETIDYYKIIFLEKGPSTQIFKKLFLRMQEK